MVLRDFAQLEESFTKTKPPWIQILELQESYGHMMHSFEENTKVTCSFLNEHDIFSWLLWTHPVETLQCPADPSQPATKSTNW